MFLVIYDVYLYVSNKLFSSSSSSSREYAKTDGADTIVAGRKHRINPDVHMEYSSRIEQHDHIVYADGMEHWMHVMISKSH